MKLVPLFGRLVFLLGGFLLLMLGMLTMGRAWWMVLSAAGIYFMARGACFVGAALTSTD